MGLAAGRIDGSAQPTERFPNIQVTAAQLTPRCLTDAGILRN